MDKVKLDEIIDKYKGQPVGHGYIDIIVSRENYKEFVSDLVKYGYVINNISWWEWCPENKESEYGQGGPKSQFYDGWFSELSIEIDEIDIGDNVEGESIFGIIINKIENKTISFREETITFMQNQWLTPAFWLDVPDDWRNRNSA